jgi:hypothetical protein
MLPGHIDTKGQKDKRNKGVFQRKVQRKVRRKEETKEQRNKGTKEDVFGKNRTFDH